MANYNEHKCWACGRIYEYCRRCAITPVIYKAEGFCSENCHGVFNILSKHGCNLITAEQTLEELAAYQIDEKFNDGIMAHIMSLESQVIIKEETSSIEEEIIPVDVADEE